MLCSRWRCCRPSLPLVINISNDKPKCRVEPPCSFTNAQIWDFKCRDLPTKASVRTRQFSTTLLTKNADIPSLPWAVGVSRIWLWAPGHPQVQGDLPAGPVTQPQTDRSIPSSQMEYGRFVCGWETGGCKVLRSVTSLKWVWNLPKMSFCRLACLKNVNTCFGGYPLNPWVIYCLAYPEWDKSAICNNRRLSWFMNSVQSQIVYEVTQD